jgi:hypothetical protein
VVLPGDAPSSALRNLIPLTVGGGIASGRYHGGRQVGGPIAFARASWIGGQGTSPNEQNTQQSPGFAFIRIPQLLQS